MKQAKKGTTSAAAKKTEQAGHFHPISLVISEIAEIFHTLGFSVASGPEIETEHYNFDVLNIPPDHPARDMWDTFWLKDRRLGDLLRTHTSPVQARHMEAHPLPIRIIAPGKVFRHEATDATHEAQFYQIEGLMVEKGATLGHLKGVLEVFFGKFFGKKTGVRLRPSYFPFVEPGVEVDISCFKCESKGCGLCKYTGFIEIMGAGMVHPYVLSTAGIDPRVYQGFAFGTGVDRLALLKYGIDDVRLSYQGDLRFVNQF
jgi:phenylalanyl-tRNA synthetase alpha chain